MRLVFTRHNRGSTWQISKDHHGLSGGAAFVNSKAGQELHVEAHPGHLMKLVPNSTCCLQSREKSSKQEEQFHHQIRSFPLHTWYLHTFQLLDQLEDAKVKGMSVLAKDCFSIWPSSCWMDQNEARLRSCQGMPCYDASLQPANTAKCAEIVWQQFRPPFLLHNDISKTIKNIDAWPQEGLNAFDLPQRIHKFLLPSRFWCKHSFKSSGKLCCDMNQLVLGLHDRATCNSVPQVAWFESGKGTK